MFSVDDLSKMLTQLGLCKGDLIMAHIGLRKIGPMESGADSLLQAILQSIGSEGTLSSYVDYQITPKVPYFDLNRSPAKTKHGVFSEIVRSHPEAIRSRNPGASVSAIGKNAEWLCENHAYNFGYGRATPFEKIAERGNILIIGATFGTCTLRHYVEHIVDVPNKKIVNNLHTVIDGGGIKELNCQEVDTSKHGFALQVTKKYDVDLMKEFFDTGKAQKDIVGLTPAYYFRGKDYVDFALNFLEKKFS